MLVLTMTAGPTRVASAAVPGTVPPPAEIAAALEQRVFGQTTAVRETAIAIAKRLADLQAGNLLLIGSSGTGKTTLLRAVEAFLAADPELAGRATLIRIHANLLVYSPAEVQRTG